MPPATKRDAASQFAEASDPERMRTVLERYLRAAADPPIEVVSCDVTFARHRPSRSLFQYEVTLRDPDSGAESTRLVGGVAYGGARTRRAWDRVQRRHPMSATNGAALARAAYVLELDLLLQTFPFDHQLPALESLLAGPLPGLVDPLLNRFGEGDWRLAGCDAAIVRYRVDLRACVRLTLRASEDGTGRSAERRFFAKVYPNAKQAERARAIQRDLTAALAAADVALAIAPTAAHLRKERVLVLDEVGGTSLRDTLRHEADGAPVVRRTARAIAALHRLAIAAPRHRIELGRTGPERVRLNAGRLRATHPDLAPLIAEVEAGILLGLDAIGDVLSVPVHGDLKPDHVLLDEDRVVLLDLDKFAAGEPMLDVTSLIINFRRDRLGRGGKRGRELTQAFVDEYFANTPAEWEPRLRPHLAATILADAAAISGSVRRAARRQRNDGVGHLLEEAQAVLAGGAW